MKNVKLTQEIVKELLYYDPETGILTWKPRDAKWFTSEKYWKSWRTQCEGKEALKSICFYGYKFGIILKKRYTAHRIIWLYVTGEWPDTIDHINGDTIDNRWVNLRNVSQKENTKNRRMTKTNKSGFQGVRWNKKQCKWVSNIQVDRKQHHLGYFNNIDDAIAARRAAEIKYGFHPNHGR